MTQRQAPDPLVRQLEGLRAQAQALVMTIEGVLASYHGGSEMEDVIAAAVHDLQEECQHPDESRLPAPRMGAPGAWACKDCGVEGGKP